jgi:cell division protein FtsL
MRKYFFLVVAIIIMIFIYIWQQNVSIRLAYKVSNLKSDYDKINSENDILRLKINSILALEKMDKMAKEKKFSRVDEKNVIYID